MGYKIAEFESKSPCKFSASPHNSDITSARERRVEEVKFLTSKIANLERSLHQNSYVLFINILQNFITRKTGGVVSESSNCLRVSWKKMCFNDGERGYGKKKWDG